MENTHHLIIKAIRKEAVPRTPIWLMRQAGRYLPEYREVRKKYSFIEMYKTPELATEVTLQPIRRFAFDAAILFSDILVIPEAMGMNLEFNDGTGPALSPQISSEGQLSSLQVKPVGERLEFVSDAIRMINSELRGSTPLIGFSGSPFTLATYMVEGKPSRHFQHIKTLLYRHPEVLTQLLDMLTEAVTSYLIMQIKAGVHIVQIFDTWGGILPGHLYESFSANYLNTIVNNLKPYDIPVILFAKGGISLLRTLSGSKADMLGVDWMTDMAEAHALSAEKFALQGNLDPTALYGNHDTIRHEVKSILSVFGGQSGHVFNLGHGILPDIPVENVHHLVDEVRLQSEQLHSGDGA
jgi:uroporphyrinogen decarboxylase